MINIVSCGLALQREAGGVWRVCIAVVVASFINVGATAFAADAPLTYDDCGDVFKNSYGPFDYNDPEAREFSIEIVETAHFTPDVERLVKGSTGSIMGDLDYTLRAIPNHHRALNAVARYDLDKGGIPADRKSAQCYFQRATVFRPNDGMVWLIYGNYQTRKGLYDKGLEAYERAKALMPASIEVDYNLGLLYFKLGEYDKALAHAKVAYAGSYPLQGLRRQLSRKGYDVDKQSDPMIQ